LIRDHDVATRPAADPVSRSLVGRREDDIVAGSCFDDIETEIRMNEISPRATADVVTERRAVDPPASSVVGRAPGHMTQLPPRSTRVAQETLLRVVAHVCPNGVDRLTSFVVEAARRTFASGSVPSFRTVTRIWKAPLRLASLVS